MVICLSLFMDILTQADLKTGSIGLVLIFSTYIGAAFYIMIFWTMLKPSTRQLSAEHCSWTDMLLGFSPVPHILFWATLMIIKVAND
jgi:hypothetical protein